MFTGLIETTGTVTAIRRAAGACTIGLIPDLADFSAQTGDSVAIDGVCLTLEKLNGRELFFTAVQETLERTTLARAAAKTRVNLERSLAANGRFHGHMVLGHVDGVGRIVSITPQGAALRYVIRLPRECPPLVAHKGSLAIDGISLTVASIRGDECEIAVIPATQKATTLSGKKAGSQVNVECDVIARYVHRAVHGGAAPQERVGSGERLLATMERSGF